MPALGECKYGLLDLGSLSGFLFEPVIVLIALANYCSYQIVEPNFITISTTNAIPKKRNVHKRIITHGANFRTVHIGICFPTHSLHLIFNT